MKRIWLVLLAALALAAARHVPANAHEVRPAFLEITEAAPGRYEITWKQPTYGDVALRLRPHLSNGWLETTPADQFATPSFLIRTWRVTDRSVGGVAGQSVAVEGLDKSITDVLVRVRLSDGRSLETILKPDRPSQRLAFAATGGLPVPAYLALGVEHILTGIDHLMFVLGLLLLVGVRWRLIKAITAFTAAHSITLAASAVGLVHVPSAVIEALVALSIVFVAAELARTEQEEPGLTRRWPWLIAFVFGLLHGFAFAGALAEVGLPKDAIPLSLFLFNLGVEIGQLIFVAAAVGVMLALRRLTRSAPAAWTALAPRIPPYAIGSFAAFWFIERAAFAFS